MRFKGNQLVTYWEKTGENDYGEELFAAPTTFDARWEDRNEQVRLPTGELIVSKSIVYVPQQVSIGSFLIEGDYLAVTDPTSIGAREIQSVLRIPSLRTNEMERRAIL